MGRVCREKARGGREALDVNAIERVREILNAFIIKNQYLISLKN